MKIFNKKIWLFITMFIFMITIELVNNQISAEVYNGTCGENVTWTLDTETGVLTIDGEGEMSDYSYSTPAPWSDNANSVTSVIINEGVISIGYGAFFHCTSLISITIHDSVTSIGEYAFFGCDSLTIYCEAESQPSEWDTDWNLNNCPVVWGWSII